MKLSWVHSISPQKSHHRLESPRATWAKPVRKASPGGACVSGLYPLVSSRLSLMSALTGSPSAPLSWNPAEVNLSPLGGDDTSSSPPLAGSQTLWPVPPWSRVSIRGQWLNPIQRGQPKDEGRPRATPGFGGYWFIPPLLSKPIFGQPPL